jgi:hypothetical protein
MLSLAMARVPGPARFARMAGSSIAAPGASAWVTDFLNAAYYARAEDERDVADLRLAHGILTTQWSRRAGGRLGALDIFELHRAFYGRRRARQGRLDGAALREGAAELLGDWFPAAWDDDASRGYGIAFPTVAARAAFDPARRLRRGALHPLTAPIQAPERQHWATYDPVRLPDPAAALKFLADPARWPDMGSANGRFTPVRHGGLLHQTFEIEVVAAPVERAPVFTRGYVTCTALHLRPSVLGGEPDREAAVALDAAVTDLLERYEAGAGPDAVAPLPDGGQPLALVVLTTHEGHFLGRGLSQLLVWRDTDGAWIRDIGAWDPLPPHLAAAYGAAGKQAQHEFWGPTPAERSMLAQLALVA